MSIFDKLKKNGGEPQTAASEEKETVKAQQESKGEEISAVGVKVDLSSKEAVDKRLKKLYAAESLYIILSAGMADFERGISVPMVLMPKEEQRVILVFSDYAKAKRYVVEKRPMVIDGVYPIGEIKKSDSINNIDVICANALSIGITAIDFDVDDENGFGCKLPYFMQLNKMDGQGQVIMTKEEMELVKANGGKFKPRFNAMRIVDFTNPYEIGKERADEVVNALLGENAEQWARDNAAVHELCYGANQLMFKAVQAENEDEELAERCKKTVDIINEVIFDKLAGLKKWYTLVNAENNEIYTKNGAAYIIYTQRYGNRMPEGTKLIAIAPSVAELAYVIGDKSVNMVAVTDGPKIMHIIDRAVFGF